MLNFMRAMAVCAQGGINLPACCDGRMHAVGRILIGMAVAAGLVEIGFHLSSVVIRQVGNHGCLLLVALFAGNLFYV